MKTGKNLARWGLVSAVYVVFCVVFAPFSYGAVQVRVSEALTLLPFFAPGAVVAVTVGCFLANLLGGSPIDMVFGTLATLAAALLTAWVGRAYRKSCGGQTANGIALPGNATVANSENSAPIKWLLLAALPPILINAVVIGAEIAFFFTPGGGTAAVFAASAISVGLGQAVSCGVLGVMLANVVAKNPALRRFFTE